MSDDAGQRLVASPGRAREEQRQRSLLALLWRAQGGGDAGLAGSDAEQARGLWAYRANAAALAERSLAAAFPTVQQLLGESSFAALARAHWHAHPPQRGDVSRWGETLPQAIAGDPQLSAEPYLSDTARLDWAVHEAGLAADDETPVQGLERLAGGDPDALQVRLRAGSTVVVSSFPIFDIWQAHQGLPTTAAAVGAADDRFEQARRSLHAGLSQAVWVTRDGSPAVQVLPLDSSGAGFVQAVLAGQALGPALLLAGNAFDFEAWLIQALRRNALSAILSAVLSAVLSAAGIAGQPASGPTAAIPAQRAATT